MNRDFKGIWIPREIWLDNRISTQEKCLWAEIHSLHDREKGGSFASNAYLCEFLGVKERRLQDMLANLKEKGLLLSVSYDGRTRIMRAIMPPEVFDLSDTAPLRCNKMHPRGAEKCTPEVHFPAPPSDYIDISLDKSLEKQSSAPLQGAESASPRSADADRCFSFSFTQKKEEENAIFENPTDQQAFSSIKPPECKSKTYSQEVKNLVDSVLQKMLLDTPSYKIPKNLEELWAQADFLLRLDHRTQEDVLAVTDWLLSDKFWAPKLFKRNPIKYLREKFDEFYRALKTPTSKKYAPCSDQKRAKAFLEDMQENSI